METRVYRVAMQVLQSVSGLKEREATKRRTYDAESANNFFRSGLHIHDNVVDKVCSHANDGNHGDDLHHADHEKGRRERSGAVAWDLHGCRLRVICRARVLKLLFRRKTAILKTERWEGL